MSIGIMYTATPPSSTKVKQKTVTACGFRSEARIRPFKGRLHFREERHLRMWVNHRVGLTLVRQEGGADTTDDRGIVVRIAASEPQQRGRSTRRKAVVS